MTENLTSEKVWQALDNEIFAVLGMVTAQQQARTVGVVYVVDKQRLYISSGKEAWKVKHIAQNPHVSVTVPIAKHIPLMPWIKIPAATITFSGQARLLQTEQASQTLRQALFRDMAQDEAMLANTVIIEVTPQGHFITYGVGVSLLGMRDPEQARGRVSV